MAERMGGDVGGDGGGGWEATDATVFGLGSAVVGCCCCCTADSQVLNAA